MLHTLKSRAKIINNTDSRLASSACFILIFSKPWGRNIKYYVLSKISNFPAASFDQFSGEMAPKSQPAERYKTRPAINIIILMKPNELKEYSPQFLAQFQYQAESSQLYQRDYQQVPAQSTQLMPIPAPGSVVNPYPMQLPPQPQAPNQPLAPAPASSQSESHSGRSRGKRRSKNDNEGRNYKCTKCGRTYLSYPALYTHNKTKHASQNDAPHFPIRGRGRPRKNVRTVRNVSRQRRRRSRTRRHHNTSRRRNEWAGRRP